MNRINSVRRLLLAWLLAPLLALLVAGAIAAYIIALNAATTAYDRALLDGALALAEQIDIANGKATLNLPPEAQRVLLTDKDDRMYYRVTGLRGEFVAGHNALLPAAQPARPGIPVYYDSMFRGKPVRVAMLSVSVPGGKILVQMAETLVKRQKLTWEILLGMLVPEILLAAAAIGLVWYGVGRGLAPIERLRSEIAARSHLDLSPVPEGPVPMELQPVVYELNKLLTRLGLALSGQQRFLADAAHQLRTPLAGLQTQVELALRQTDPDDLRHTLQQAHTAAIRTARLANQLLSLARSEPGGHRPDALQRVDLHQVAEETAAQWVPRAAAKNIDLGFELEAAWVQAEPLLLRELLANLLDNAIRYTQPSGRITVRTMMRNSQAWLQVEDNGPGIPEHERHKVVERFYRIEGTPGDGSGLGLAIALEIARTNDAELKLETPPGGRGTLASVIFHPAA